MIGKETNSSTNECEHSAWYLQLRGAIGEAWAESVTVFGSKATTLDACEKTLLKDCNNGRMAKGLREHWSGDTTSLLCVNDGNESMRLHLPLGLDRYTWNGEGVPWPFGRNLPRREGHKTLPLYSRPPASLGYGNWKGGHLAVDQMTLHQWSDRDK